MTKREAAIVTAYTGYLVGDFSDAHVYIEQILGRPVMTHEMAFGPLWTEIQAAAKKDFTSLEATP